MATAARGRAAGGATTGAALCVLSAAGFGAMAIFGKLAYEAGVSTLSLLCLRFVLAGLIFSAVIAARPGLRPGGAGRRALAVGLALGAIGYAAQSGLFFAALRRLDASLLALLLYTYPAWVTVAAFALGRERPTVRRLVALTVSSVGLVVVLAGAVSGDFDPLGAALGLGAAVAYTIYILVAHGSGGAMPSLALSTLVCIGAAATFAVVGSLTGQLRTDFAPDGWVWIGAIAVVSTAVPIAAFFAGMARVGPSAASILSTFEPVVTVALAFVAFGERLSAAQLAGAVLVLAAAVLLAARESGPEPAPPA